MPKIDFQIGQQSFEIIRTRVFDILVDELSGQTAMAGVGVYAERTVPFDSSELPAINIKVAQIDNSNKHQGQSRQEQVFTIDSFALGVSGDDSRGDFLAALEAQKIAGVCRYILEDTRYKTLGFVPPFIEKVFVRSLSFTDHNTNDTEYIQQVRIELVVQAPEINQLVPPRLLEGYQTEVTLDNSDSGFFRTT